MAMSFRTGVGSGVAEVFVEGADQFGFFVGVAGPGVGGFTDGSLGEGLFGLLLAALEEFVFEESGGAEGIEKMLLDLADFQFASGADEVGAQVEAGVLAVEKFEAGDQAGGTMSVASEY